MLHTPPLQAVPTCTTIIGSPVPPPPTSCTCAFSCLQGVNQRAFPHFLSLWILHHMHPSQETPSLDSSFQVPPHSWASHTALTLTLTHTHIPRSSIHRALLSVPPPRLTGFPLGPSSPVGPLGPGGPASPGCPDSPFSPRSPRGPWGMSGGYRWSQRGLEDQGCSPCFQDTFSLPSTR